MAEGKRKYTNPPYCQPIGPLTTQQFTKMQSILSDFNEQVRMEALYNLLVMMKEEDQKEETK